MIPKRIYSILLFFILFTQSLFAVENEAILEFTSNYIKYGHATESPAFLPEYEILFDTGFSLQLNGIFPFKKIMIPSKKQLNYDIDHSDSTTRYIYEIDFSTYYTYKITPYASILGGLEFDWIPNYKSDNDTLVNFGLSFDFIIGASFFTSYSPKNNYFLFALPLSFQHKIIKDVECGLRIIPNYYLDSHIHYFSSLSSTLSFAYLLTTDFTIGPSFTYIYLFHEKNHHYLVNLFMNYTF